MSSRPVYEGDLSPARVPSENDAPEPRKPVFPILHTAYDYNERF
jgi:hypothetical protein